MSGRYQRKDHLYKKAKESGYRSRASYKLEELDKRFRLLRKGFSVVDLGCFPGGWLQVAARGVGEKGKVVGVDLKEVQELKIVKGCARVHILKGDIRSNQLREQIAELLGGSANVILSDMSPHLSGIKFRDNAQSAALVECALEVADSLLTGGGSMIAKIFPSEDADEIFKRMQTKFKRVQRAHLSSTRKTSNELYLVGLGYNRNTVLENRSETPPASEVKEGREE